MIDRIPSQASLLCRHGPAHSQHSLSLCCLRYHAVQRSPVPQHFHLRLPVLYLSLVSLQRHDKMLLQSFLLRAACA